MIRSRSRALPTPRQGDFAITLFDFEDGRPPRRRPVVVISSDRFNASRREVVVRAVSSRLDPAGEGDCLLEDWQRGGLQSPSRVTVWLKTVPRGALELRVGALTPRDWRLVRTTTRLDILGM